MSGAFIAAAVTPAPAIADLLTLIAIQFLLASNYVRCGLSYSDFAADIS